SLEASIECAAIRGLVERRAVDHDEAVVSLELAERRDEVVAEDRAGGPDGALGADVEPLRAADHLPAAVEPLFVERLKLPGEPVGVGHPQAHEALDRRA